MKHGLKRIEKRKISVEMAGELSRDANQANPAQL